MAGRPIDEKIVAMKMDNSDFKAKAVETTSLFGKMQAALSKIPGVNMGDITKSFGEIQAAASKIDLGSIADNVDKLSGRFSNLGIVAMTALSNITNKVVDAGLELAKNTFIQPITDGFKEYELMMGSIQTILANTQAKGTTLDDVKNSLNELNTYADKTIYSFSDMTKNIGFFTNAGLGLKESTAMIKGFSNAAAASGSNAEQAANAAYQLSQGLSSGYIMAQDWMSLTNAGMGNDNMKRDLINIAQAMGTLKKGTATTNATMKDWKGSLTDGKWLTTNVMSTYLQSMTGDMDEATLMTKGLTKAQADLLIQNAKTGFDAATKVRTWTQMIGTLAESVGSGWSTTFQLIFGDFNQATDLWTGMTNALSGFINILDNARNGMVKGFADAGIFKGFFDIIIKGANAVVAILTAIGQGFTNAFAGEHSNALKDIGNAMEKFANALTPSAETLKVITTIFQGLFSIVRIGVDIFLALGKILITVIKVPLELIGLALKGLVFVIGGVLNFVAKLVIAFTDAIHSGTDLSSKLGGLQGVFSKIGSWIGKGIKALGDFGNAIKEVWNFLKTGDLSAIGPWAKSTGIIDKLESIRNAVKTFVSGVKEAWDILEHGSFDSNAGPFGADSKIVEKLFTIREAVKTAVAEIGQAWNILAKGDYTAGPWDEDSRIVDILFRIREAVQACVKDIVETWSILSTGKVSSNGPWDKDSEIVSKLLKIRAAVQQFVSYVAEAWSVLTKGEITKGGPWGAESEIVGALFRIRNSVLDIGKVFDAAGQAIGSFWDYLTKKKTDVKMPWADNAASAGMSVLKAGVGELGTGFEHLESAIGQTWGILAKGEYVKGPWSSDSIIVAGLEKIRTAAIDVGKYLGSLNLSLAPVANGFKSFFNVIGEGFNWLKEKLAAIGKSIKDAMPSGDKILAGGFLAAMATVSAIVLKMWLGFAKSLKGWAELGGALKETLESVSGAFDAFSKTMKTNNTVAIIVATAVAVGILAVALKLLSTIKGNDVYNSLISLTTAMSALIGGMAIITKYDLKGTGMKAALQMVAMGIAIDIMASALMKLSKLNLAEVGKGILGLAGIMISLSGAVVLMSKFGGKEIGASSLQFLALAGAILIMVKAVQELGTMDINILKQGLTTLGFIMVELSIFFAIVKGSHFGIGDSLAFLAIARAISNIVDAIQEIGKIKVEVLQQGLETIGYILLELMLFAQLTKSTNLLSTAAGLLILSVALNALIVPITIMGHMDIVTLAKGIGAMAVALAAIGAASLLMKDLISSGAGLILVAIALNMLLVPILAMSRLSWEQIAKGVVGLAGGLALIGGVAALLGLASELILAFGVAIGVVGLAMLAAGAGMTLFAGALVTLATMSAASITSILAVFGTFIAGLAAMLPSIISFVAKIVVDIASAIATNAPIIGAKIAETLLGLMDVIIKYLPQFIDKGVQIITELVVGMGQAIPQLISAAVQFIVQLINGMAQGIADNGPQLIAAMSNLIGQLVILMIEMAKALIDGFLGWIPGVKDATAQMADSAEKSIRDNFHATEAGSDKGKEFADGLNSQSGNVSSAGMNLAISGKTASGQPEYVSMGAMKGQEFLSGLSAQSGGVQKAGQAVSLSGKAGTATPDFSSIGVQKGQEFLAGLNGQAGGSRNAGFNVANSGKGGASSVDLSGTGSQKGQDFVNALQAKEGSARSSGAAVASSGKSGLQSVDATSSGSWFAQGFANGISSKTSTVQSVASALGSAAHSALNWFLHINSPSRLMMTSGGWFGDGFAIGISNKTATVTNSAKNLAKTAKDSVNKFIDGFELPKSDNELHFKAVVDYDALDTSKFGSITPIAVKPNVALTNGLVTATKVAQSQNGSNSTSTVDNSVANNHNYNINVQAKTTSTRAEIKTLAQQIQTELKNINDRTKISRGEGVAF